MKDSDYLLMREAVAQACFEEWCQQNGADCAWRGHGCDTPDCTDIWEAIAERALSVVQEKHRIVEETE